MIFNKDVLFIHIPKTAGTSIRNVLYDYLQPPVIDHIACGTPNKHLTASQLGIFLEAYSMKWSNFKKIIAVYRNPYAVEVSLYHYFLSNPLDPRGKNDSYCQEVIKQTFKEFVLTNKWPNFDHFLRGIPQSCLDRLQILTVETLEQDINKLFLELGIFKSDESIKLPVLNISNHKSFETYYDKETELAVYKKYSGTFDNKIYERLALDG